MRRSPPRRGQAHQQQEHRLAHPPHYGSSPREHAASAVPRPRSRLDTDHAAGDRPDVPAVQYLVATLADRASRSAAGAAGLDWSSKRVRLLEPLPNDSATEGESGESSGRRTARGCRVALTGYGAHTSELVCRGRGVRVRCKRRSGVGTWAMCLPHTRVRCQRHYGLSGHRRVQGGVQPGPNRPGRRPEIAVASRSSGPRTDDGFPLAPVQVLRPPLAGSGRVSGARRAAGPLPRQHLRRQRRRFPLHVGVLPRQGASDTGNGSAPGSGSGQ